MNNQRCQTHRMRACRELLLYGLYFYDKQIKNASKNTERLKFHDFNIYPNILHGDADADAEADADADAGGIAIALLH